MKTRFTTLDVSAAILEIQHKLVGLRIANVYDVDNKTYLLKLAKPDLKAMILIESGIRIHISEFDWPKNPMPSGFSMKMRKHLRGRRLVSAKQLGIDRIVDLQFGTDDAAYHLVIELYDRGNIALTDSKYTILNLLRFRKDANTDADVRIAVHEVYPIHSAKQRHEFLSKDELSEIIKKGKDNDLVKRILIPHLAYGAACIDHCFLLNNIPLTTKVTESLKTNEEFLQKLHDSLKHGEKVVDFILSSNTCKGYILQKEDKKSDGEIILTNTEYHPYLFQQHTKLKYVEVDSFNKSIDEFYGNLESQKADMKILQHEKNAMKTLNNFKKDHEQRLSLLEKEQENDTLLAQLIEENLQLVDQAIKIVRSAIANQIDWNEINHIIKDAQSRHDPVAMAISKLKLETNHIVMLLTESTYDNASDNDDDYFSSDDDVKDNTKSSTIRKPVKVEIDLGMSAYGNAKKYYDMKRHAINKKHKTIQASEKAYKSAEKKTAQALKDVAAVQSIQKARKPFWFEKFLWFITSENYLVLGGRDAQQNEILVRRYLKPGDVYVHADVHGATSCIVKNPNGVKEPIPPKSLVEAGNMAICHSAAWDAKIVISAWWVYHDQVSKTAPSGEYLTTGSFLIRGKKNYLPPSFLVYGFGFLFKVDETCVWRHKGERKVRTVNDDVISEAPTEDTLETDDFEEELNPLSDEEDNNSEEDGKSIRNKNTITLPQVHNKTKTYDPDNNSNGEQTIKKLNIGDSVSHSDENNAEKEVSSVLESNSRMDIINSNESESLKSENNNYGNDTKSSQTTKVVSYPDTVVKLHLVTDHDKYKLDDATKDKTNQAGDACLGDEKSIYVNKESQPGSKPRMSAKERRDLKKKNKASGASETSKRDDDVVSVKSTKSIPEEPLKRGQKNRKNKIKNKYKDQDEEEREMKMKLLQQASEFNASGKRAKKQEKQRKQEELYEKRQKDAIAKQIKPKPKPKFLPPQDDDRDSDEEREMILMEEHLLNESANILDSLTGCPHPEDTLLFAVPICAPYNVMQNYKFRVKLTPGNTKKGKAAKSALALFQSMKDITALEKTHLKSVKDNDLNRYMPGKVKVSAPHIQGQRRKK